jgi:hypothetical protein
MALSRSRQNTGTSPRAVYRNGARVEDPPGIFIVIRAPTGRDEHEARGVWQELTQVNLIRERLSEWRRHGWPGVTRTTLELLEYWRRDGRHQRLFLRAARSG